MADLLELDADQMEVTESEMTELGIAPEPMWASRAWGDDGEVLGNED